MQHVELKVILKYLKVEVEQRESVTFRQIGEDGAGVEGVFTWEDVEPHLMTTTLVQLQETTQAQGEPILKLITDHEWGLSPVFLLTVG